MIQKITLAKYIVSLGGVGFIRPASATWGTLASMPIAYSIATMLSPLWLVGASAIIFLLGWWATTVYESQTQKHDASEIVIDETAGICITLAVVPVDVTLYAIGFLLFRFFDIAKIYPANHIDAQKTPFSVMFDDVIAGFYAMVCLWGIWQLGIL